MAPRPRGRRPIKMGGQTRMDAALDAMRCYGFPEHFIFKTIKELLNVYSEDGWVFIEEASYKVLLGAILEKVEGEAEKMDDPLLEDGKGGNHTTALMAGSSSGVIAPSCSNPESIIVASQVNEALATSSQTNEVPDTTTVLPTNEGLIGNGCSRRLIYSPEKVDALPMPKPWSRPYHGWIGSNQEEDLVTLTAAPLPKELADLFCRLRKRRWDVKPGDTRRGGLYC